VIFWMAGGEAAVRFSAIYPRSNIILPDLLTGVWGARPRRLCPLRGWVEAPARPCPLRDWVEAPARADWRGFHFCLPRADWRC
jgi:hypothetical protein